MRLLRCAPNTRAIARIPFSLTEFPASNIPPYAILSHRWTNEEVTFSHLRDGKIKKSGEGYRKLDFCAKQAASDGIVNFWVDTCCIDKANNTELSEAINSMFKWYKNANKCYVYMSDVSIPGRQQAEVSKDQWLAAFRASAWFTRGWTLQELIAPSTVEFYSREGKLLGNRQALEQEIEEITGIPAKALRGAPLSQFNDQERLSWAAKRVTTVDEDSAYCLMGLFGVHMPLIYGEGRQRAMTRLQREIQTSSADVPLRLPTSEPWIVPFERNSHFVGREKELALLERQLFTHDQTSRWAIIGLGGVGKTQLIIEVLHRIRTKYRDCKILWIPAVSDESLYQGYLSVARQLNIPGCDRKDADAVELVRSHLSKSDSGRWLLVFDNADDIDMWTKEKTPEYGTSGQSQPRRLMDRLPQNERGCIVFTTRDRKAATKLAGPNVMHLSVMNERVAVDMLNKYLIASVPPAQHVVAAQLVADLAYLPLAIVQAAAYINTNGCTLEDYQELLHQKEEEVVSLLSEDFEAQGRYENVKNPVATTWLISFEQIRERHPLAVEYLSFMACVHYKNIPQSLLPPGPSRLKEMEAIGTLTAYSFVERRVADSSLDLHRLVHLSTRNWLRKEELLDLWQQKTLDHLEKVFPADDGQYRSLWRTYLPHAQFVLRSSDHDEAEPHRASLMMRCAKCLYHDGRWYEAEHLFSRVVKMSNSTPDSDVTSVFNCNIFLASTYNHQGRKEEAVELQLQVVEAMKLNFGDDSVATLLSMHYLAVMYENQGLWEKAEELYVETRNTFMTKHKESSRYILYTTSCLAALYSQQARWEELDQLQLQMEDMLKSEIGDDHNMVISSMAELAATYAAQSRWTEAEELLVYVVETRKSKLGLEHSDTLRKMGELGCIYWNQGRLQEAEELGLQVVEISNRTLGTDHVNTVHGMNDLSLIYQDQQRWAEAAELQEHVVERNVTHLGKDHPSTLVTMRNLANSWYMLGRGPEAIALLKDSVERQGRVFGTSHPHFLKSNEFLCEWQAEDGNQAISNGDEDNPK